MSVGIYIIEHVSGKAYIGQSIEVEARLKAHLRMLQCGDHHCLYLQRAWKKYGEAAFTFRQLLSCDRDSLDHYENHFFTERGRNGLYNVQLVAKHVYHTAEAKAKISAAMSGRNREPKSEETKAKIRATALTRSSRLIIARNGSFEKRFSSMTEAANALKLSKQTVWNCLNGRQMQSKGWFFSEN